MLEFLVNLLIAMWMGTLQLVGGGSVIASNEDGTTQPITFETWEFPCRSFSGPYQPDWETCGIIVEDGHIVETYP